MIDAYGVLRVPSDADAREIRNAYLNLAKRLHPDRSGGGHGATQRFQKINQAYELLKDPDTRSAYDQLVARRRAGLRRWRVTEVRFALTLAVASAALLLAATWRQHVRPLAVPNTDTMVGAPHAGADPVLSSRADAAPQVPMLATDAPKANKAPIVASGDMGTGSWQGAQVSPHSQLGAAQPASTQLDPTLSQTDQPRIWATYRNDRFGFALDYPSDVFVSDNEGLGGFWRLLISRDGQARLLVVAGFNRTGATPASYRQSLVRETYAAAHLEYAPLRSTWFVLAGSMGEDMFYERATFACSGRIIHGWRLTYPSAKREYYSKVIERIHQGYKHARGMGGHCR